MLCVGIGPCPLTLYQVQRNTNTARQTNPYPYHADYFGHKLHMDQNEKLAMYGLTEVSACDGYSGKIVAFATMSVKNNALIYENVYRYSIGQSLKIAIITVGDNNIIIIAAVLPP